MAERTAILAIAGVVLSSVWAPADAAEPVAAEGKRIPPKHPVVLVAKTSSPDVVLHVRSLLPRRAPQDPIKLAVHFSSRTGPLALQTKPRPPLIDFVKTFESLTFDLTTPDGRPYRLRAAIIDNRPRWAKGRTGLAYGATWFLDLSADGLETNLGLGGKWRLEGPPDLTRPGEYKVRVAGRLMVLDGKPIELTSPLLVTHAVKDCTPAAELRKLAMAAIGRHLPAFKPAEQTYTSSGYTPGVVYEDGSGDRVIHHNGRIGPARWGYELARVVISPRGVVRSVAYRSVSTCIAAGTPIDTPGGPVPVERLREGDEVWGYDLKARRRVVATIRAIRRAAAARCLRIGPSLRITGNHPVCTPGGWLPAGALRPGHRLLDRHGRWTPLPPVRPIEGRLTVYDLTVDAPHTYFAGGVLVHNKDRPWHPGLDDPWHFYWPGKPHKFTVAYRQPGAAAKTRLDPKEIAALIRQLGHENWKTREAATEQLRKMGEPAFGMLREARKRKDLDPEIAQRIDLILAPGPPPPGKTATDPATGITISLEPDGTLAARIRDRMLWRLKLAQDKVTGLMIVNGRVVIQPHGTEIDVKTGRLLRVRK